MQVKRYVAENMRSALKQVREELGSEAVILSNKRVPAGVELLVALEQNEPSSRAADMPSVHNPFQQQNQTSRANANATAQPSRLEVELEQMQLQARQRAEVLAAALAKQQAAEKEALLAVTSSGNALVNDTAINDAQRTPERVELKSPSVADKYGLGSATGGRGFENDQADELAQMRAELQSMRDLLEQQLSTMAWGQFNHQHPQKAGLWRRLKRMGITAAVANGMLNSLDLMAEGDDAFKAHHCWKLLMTDFCRQLPVVEGDLLSRGGIFAFVGPTGAGKSTTIGKLATRYVLEHGATDIALVTTDTMRIAAHEQLRTFGRILNVPVKVVDKNNSLERVLYSLRHKSVVLVDTAGLNRQDPRLKQQLATLNEMGGRINTVLVIPVTSQLDVIRAAYHTYKTDNLLCCTLTKLDEATCLGGAMSLAVEKQLPLAYSTDGQEIPNDIAVADARSLIRLAIELAKHVNTDHDAMAEEMATLAKAQ
jgi:flagellar biosynthesis protein FlhF